MQTDVNDFTFSDRYTRFIMPTADELREEKYVESLSDTERELYYLRKDMINGKLPHSSNYEDAVDMILFYASEAGKITDDEYRRLEEKYA